MNELNPAYLLPTFPQVLLDVGGILENETEVVFALMGLIV